jgi:hypothetical protein
LRERAAVKTALLETVEPAGELGIMKRLGPQRGGTGTRLGLLLRHWCTRGRRHHVCRAVRGRDRSRVSAGGDRDASVAAHAHGGLGTHEVDAPCAEIAHEEARTVETDLCARRTGDDLAAGTIDADPLYPENRRAGRVVIETGVADIDLVARPELALERGFDPRTCDIERKESANKQDVRQAYSENSNTDHFGAREVSVAGTEKNATGPRQEPHEAVPRARASLPEMLGSWMGAEMRVRMRMGMVGPVGTMGMGRTHR